MSELEIPDRAWRVFGSSMTYGEVCDVRDAATIIVAAELRVLAEMVEERASDASYRQPEEVTTTLLREARHLYARADELDPKG